MKSLLVRIIIPLVVLVLHLLYIPELISAQSDFKVLLSGFMLITFVLTCTYLSINIKQTLNSIKEIK
jgi:hypothetical protein